VSLGRLTGRERHEDGSFGRDAKGVRLEVGGGQEINIAKKKGGQSEGVPSRVEVITPLIS